jgi:hypothetical protein
MSLKHCHLDNHAVELPKKIEMHEKFTETLVEEVKQAQEPSTKLVSNTLVSKEE